MKRLLSFSIVLISLFGCKTNNQDVIAVHSDDKILSENRPLEESIKTSTFSLNKYWSSHTIEKATLYVYFPEHRKYKGERINNQIIIKDNQLNPFVLDSFTVELTTHELAILRSALTKESTFQESWASHCFDPHHGIVMKGKQNIILGYISICFQCNIYRMGDNYVDYLSMKMLKEFVTNHNLPETRFQISKFYHQNKL